MGDIVEATLIRMIKNRDEIRNLGIRECEGLIQYLNGALKDPEGDNHQEIKKQIHSARKIAYEHLADMKTYQGSNMFPRELFSADQLIPRLINDSKAQQAAIETSEKRITPETIKAFSRPESQRIIETVILIMDEYRRGITDAVYMDGSNYLINIDFKDLLKRAGASGDMRKKIRAMINKALAGEGQPLQYMTVKIDKTIYTYSFLTIKKARQAETVMLDRIGHMNENSTHAKAAKIESLQLEVSKEAYTFLEPYIKNAGDTLKKGQLAKHNSMGYLETPAMLIRKIENVINEALHMCEIMPPDSPLRPNIDGATIERMKTKPPEYWRLSVNFIIHTWETGKPKRKTPMKITWAKLREQHFLSAHKNSPEKRRADMVALSYICESLRKEGEILAGSDKRVSVENGNQKSYKFPVPGTIIVRLTD